MMRINLIYITIIVLFLSCKETSKPEETEKQTKNNYTLALDSFLIKLEKEKTFMGSVSLSKNGKIIYTKATGSRDNEKALSANTQTKYRIASITKTFTAVLIFKAIEEGKIQLDQTIENFFPSLPNADKITIAHLLHHQSGIQSYTKDEYFWTNRTEYQSAEDLLTAIEVLDRNFEPGENTEYSNSNYFLLSQILEIVYEDSYENLLEKRIFKPLDLQNTYVGGTTDSENNESFSYIYENDNWQLFRETHLSLAKGSGSLVSTPSDLNVFFRSLIQGELVSASSLENMTRIVRNHGMGIFRYGLHDQSGFGHGGNIDGFTSSAIYFDDIDLALSLTSNASRKPINEVYSEILNLYLGEQAIDISEEEIKKYAGVFKSLDDPSDLTVFERKDNRLILVIKGEFREPLIYKGNRRFLFNQMYGGSISFTFSEKGDSLIFEQGEFKGNYIRQ